MMQKYKQQQETEYLTTFYQRSTKELMERGFSNVMVLSFYNTLLQNNSLLDKPRDFGDLEELMIKYLTKEV